MPRNPARIDPLLDLIEQEWQAHPDLRLGQLICNLAHDQDPFYVEDDTLARRLQASHDGANPFETIDYYTDDPRGEP